MQSKDYQNNYQDNQDNQNYDTAGQYLNYNGTDF